jgi:hypothetical protein
MSLLAPLYFAGLLAISLPIIFHLIRRTPHGRQTFSSLMFLTQSPPRVTKRSRLNNIFLLLLRAAALSLLAFAFARPYLRQQAELNVSESQGRRIALLVDTSASMQRGDLWRQVAARVDEVLGDVTPADEVGLFSFDRKVTTLMTFNEWNEQEQSRRAPVLKARLSEAEPSWAATNLGDAVATVADTLADAGDASHSSAVAGRQLVLISDLQQGSRIESLQGYEWPTGVLLEVKPVTLKKPTNAGVYLVKDAADVEGDARDDRLRVRVSNEPDSTGEQFSLAWASQQGPLKTVAPLPVYVPPGRSRVVRVPWPAEEAEADRLLLSGDDHEFDNALYLVPLRQEVVRLVYVGEDAAGDTQGLRYYLHSAVPDTARRKVDFLARGKDQPLASPDLLDARLVVVTSPLAEDHLDLLRKFIESGGTVLNVIKDVAAAKSAARLMGLDALEVEEAPSGDYALLGEIAFTHPLFAPFADPRFADFTKIRFWKHRRIKLPETSEPSTLNPQPSTILARFDDGDPFLCEQLIGKGALLTATAGWHPADSQLALSTKFVPLIAGLLQRNHRQGQESQYVVTEPIELPKSDSPGVRKLRTPASEEVALAGDAQTFDGADVPGIYRLSTDGKQVPLAVNLAPDESRTSPMAVEELEHRGAKLGTQPTRAELAERQRQLRSAELENRQKLWRWLIVGVLGVLVVETTLAGHLAHRTTEQQVPQQQVTV